MKSLFNNIRCLECGTQQTANLFPDACPSCGSAWQEAGYNLSELPINWPAIVSQRETNLWRYRELLPFTEETKLVSMGEGWTPLTKAEGLANELNHKEIWIKDERQQPTGSFKDRQASSTISALKDSGVKEMVLASTGNAAAAYAAYCARAGIKLWVFLTSSVPAEKMRELGLYGAEVVKITGTYDQAKKLAADFAADRGVFCDNGAKSIPNKEGMKTIAFEISEQLGWRAPDWYIQAVSGGLGPIGVLKGFTELFEAGLIDQVPKLGLVQVEGCAPMVRSWELGLDTAAPVSPDTLINVLSTGDPGYVYNILNQAINQNGGAMLAVSDGDAFRAMRGLARTEGFSVEPAASVAFAGLERLLEEGYIQPSETVVVNCSGHTFSAEKHALEDRYIVDLQLDLPNPGSNTQEGLDAALTHLDERVTSIVIIDDNPHDSRLIRKMLQRYKKYRVFEANNASEGVDLVKFRKPDLVVLDLTMPERDGFSILDELKRDERTCDIPVMIVSGKELTLDQADFLDHNAQSVFQKGNFSGQELVRNMVEMLGDDFVQPPDGFVESAGNVNLPKQVFGIVNPSKILVVDDNVWETRLLRKLFEARHRFEVIEAHSVSEAMNEISLCIPDLIILDLILPDKGGEELLNILRSEEETKNIPVIIVSAKDLQPDKRIRLTHSADSVWLKSTIDSNSLLAHVETLLLA
ncbi:MAG: threonine synthase [Chloroflexi bacterium]|nr:threonine synthase [Chloroflexota bacterium]